MKDYKEMADSVLSRVHEYEQQENKIHARVRRVGRISVIAVPVLIIAVIGTFALMNVLGEDGIGTSGSMPKDFVGGKWPPDGGDDASYSFPAVGLPESELSDDSDGAVFASSTSESESGSSSSSENKADSTSTPDSSETYGGQHGNPFIASLPKNNKTQLIGEKITDVEAQEYFKDNADGIVSSLRASGVTIKDRDEEKRYAVSNHMIYADPNIDLAVMRGYCHVSYDGEEKPDDEPCLTVKLNFMDFPVYSGGRLVAIVTLTKENGVITSTPSFGGTWFGFYEQFMKKWADKKAKLLFVYAGAVEFIITPDNKVVNPMGLTDAVELSGLDKMSDPYTWFYNDNCTYTP